MVNFSLFKLSNIYLNMQTLYLNVQGKGICIWYFKLKSRQFSLSLQDFLNKKFLLTKRFLKIPKIFITIEKTHFPLAFIYNTS